MLRLVVYGSAAVAVLLQRDSMVHGYPVFGLDELPIVETMPMLMAMGFFLSGVLGRGPWWHGVLLYTAVMFQTLSEELMPAKVYHSLSIYWLVEPMVVLCLAYAGLFLRMRRPIARYILRGGR